MRPRNVLAPATAMLLLVAPLAATAAPDTGSTGPERASEVLAGQAERIPEIASTNRMSVEQLRTLAQDPTVHVDTDDSILFVDPVFTDDGPVPAKGGAKKGPDHPSNGGGKGKPGNDGGSATGSAAFTVFSQSGSKPGADLTLFLDFDGGDYAGTRIAGSSYLDESTDWSRLPSSGLGGKAVDAAFQQVARDLAAYDVNVTTVQPPLDDLVRTDAADTRYGTTAVVTSLSADNIGGYAWMNSFEGTGEANRATAIVLAGTYGKNHQAIGAVISHEVGHTLGLHHDANGLFAYHGGNSAWGPIMGNPNRAAMTSWYDGPNSSDPSVPGQDDLRVMAAMLKGSVPDDHGDDAATATPLTAGTSVLGRMDVLPTYTPDVDVFAVQVTGGTLDATVQAGPAGGDVNARVRVLDQAGDVLADGANEVTTTYQRKSGFTVDPGSFDAAVSLSGLADGTYLVEVSGHDQKFDETGSGNLSTAATRYGSVGEYVLTVG